MRFLITAAIISFIAKVICAQVPYDNIPGWFSVEDDYYGTGAAIDDINGDGYPDLAISNGNDIVQAPNLAYINSGGFMPETAAWVSENFAYSGHCELGDYDSDGFPELAVSNYISPGWGPERVNIYDNIDGVLENSPSWISSDLMHTFRLAWGDADGDGDLDLAVATGEAYNSYFEPNLIYYNNDGILETEAGWVSADLDACYDVRWVDIELDGDLDLVFCESGGPLKIYYNYGDFIATDPGWLSEDDDNYNSIDLGDIDGDGYPELAAAANTQTGGSGRFKIFLNVDGTLETVPFWTSASSGYGSEAAFSDVDSDGDYDLICGRWWGLIYIYLNNDGSFNRNPDWNSSGSYSSVVENIVFGDFNTGAERNHRDVFFGPANRLIMLPYRQLASVDSVRLDGIVLDPEEYCLSLWDGWVSLGPPILDSVEVFYRYSISKDMAVSNWDRETYIFYNTNPGFIPGDANASGGVDGLDLVFLVNYLKGGQAPEPLLAADVNGDCAVDAEDVIYFLDYFKGGAAPLVGDCD